MSKALRQMVAKAVRVGAAHGEAVRDLISDEASGPPREHPDTGSAKPKAGTGGLLEAALTRQNLQRAWEQVKANKGAAAVDGLDIEQTAHDLKLSNRPVRTRMPGGVAGAPPLMEAPYADAEPPA